MDFLVQTIIPYVLIYKYWALFLFTLLSSLALPVPAGTLLVASAAFASQGYFNIYILFIVVILGNIIGDNMCFWVTRRYGRAVFDQYKFTRKIINSDNFKLISKKISTRPGFIIFISRFEVIATLSVNAVCGLSKVKYKKYLVFEVLGTIASVTFYGTLGYVFGDSWQAVNKLIGNFSIIIIIIVAGLVLFFWKKIMKNVDPD